MKYELVLHRAPQGAFITSGMSKTCMGAQFLITRALLCPRRLGEPDEVKIMIGALETPLPIVAVQLDLASARAFYEELGKALEPNAPAYQLIT